MRFDKKYAILYAVTDRAWIGKQNLYEQVESALKGGATCVQLREKNLDEELFLEEAIKIKSLCKKYGIPFLVNDNVDIAIKCEADGVHVGQEDTAVSKVRKLVGDKMIIGVSVQNINEALESIKNGADYLGVGAMFSTSTKLDANVIPFENLKSICNAVNIPVVAIGGIGKNNIMKLAGSGADGVALVSAIFGAKNIEEECRELRRLSEQMIKL
ncbi:thiamine phosphate synthase [Brachyspira aalborgi]|uniref:Thiamine-phosphate synthase n=1 Tax=Brachyspira aalborgi TaxID=29522 RepID=A0A5C8FVP7_9SPIR|nr:thiamine phosphate synthase [Brachyspira aalborgi]TXJ44901.1 thiamine phosphate synthase [Brachyspira aalborgi]TXJ53716.1 thiamine phosphate synthase [Brachyspira aalborgi]